MKGWMYILKCGNNKFYTGSTNDLDRRLREHQTGIGANYTKKHQPVELVYFEEFDRIDKAFYREKQIQNWSQAKKQALINGDFEELVVLSKGKRCLDPSVNSGTSSSTTVCFTTIIKKKA